MGVSVKKISDLFYENNNIDSLALGGSRARGLAAMNSDIDLFCVIYEAVFDSFKDSFSLMLTQECNMIVAAELFYLDSWGYLFKCIDDELREYDISIISDVRIDELGIKKSNVILFDKSGLYTSKKILAVDNYYDQDILARKKRKNIVNTIIIDLFYVYKEINAENQYWNCVKYVERIRRNIMIIMRINQSCVGKKYFSPEKNFPQNIDADKLYAVYSCHIINKDVYSQWKTLFLGCCDVEEQELAIKTFSLLETIGENI